MSVNEFLRVAWAVIYITCLVVGVYRAITIEPIAMFPYMFVTMMAKPGDMLLEWAGK